MTAPRLLQAAALVDTIRASLDAGGLTAAHVTLDATEMPNQALHGVVVVSPPTLDFETRWSDPEAEWEAHIIAGPATDFLAAWATIDTILEALHQGRLNLKRGTPGAFQPLGNVAPLPAYTITFNPLD